MVELPISEMFVKAISRLNKRQCMQKVASFSLQVTSCKCVKMNTGTWTIKLLMAVIRLARDKHSSLLRKSVNYGRKKFYSTGLG